MAFELISKVFPVQHQRRSWPWLDFDWIPNPKNWGSVYEQAINEHRERKESPRARFIDLYAEQAVIGGIMFAAGRADGADMALPMRLRG